jgi:hypothetical protein
MTEQRWSVDRANAWYKKQPWLVGCNFIPSTAINQLEMWQTDTFDPETIDRELGWAAGIGFNTMRVYLHDLLWRDDAETFKKTIDRYLTISESHNIKTMFVLFDDCWHDNPQLGKQPDPVPGVHNSGWLRGPGRKILNDRQSWGALKAYVQDIVTTFGNDERVLLWDMYNEVGNTYLPVLTLPLPLKVPMLFYRYLRHRMGWYPSEELLKKTFEWAREVNPSQPLSSSIYMPIPRLNSYLAETSDVITFHNYDDPDKLTAQINDLKAHGRPLICTEYLARTQNNYFENTLPIFKKEGIGCYNWGLVSGKTQTIFRWGSTTSDEEPPLWFHDVFNPDGTPYCDEEVNIIRTLTERQSTG